MEAAPKPDTGLLPDMQRSPSELGEEVKDPSHRLGSTSSYSSTGTDLQIAPLSCRRSGPEKQGGKGLYLHGAGSVSRSGGLAGSLQLGISTFPFS